MSKKPAMWIIGIDEAGRGPLAGPVVVAGIKLKVKSQKLKVLKGVRDSKKLTEKQRQKWFRLLTSHPKIEYAAAKVWPKTIDRLNIARSANLGAKRVCVKLGFSKCRILLDGGLRLSKNFPHETIIKGDEKIPIIAAASIIAKVVRDRAMLRLHKEYPRYGFNIHKGYATKLHQSAIRKFGYSDIHRKSFRLRNL